MSYHCWFLVTTTIFMHQRKQFPFDTFSYMTISFGSIFKVQLRSSLIFTLCNNWTNFYSLFLQFLFLPLLLSFSVFLDISWKKGSCFQANYGDLRISLTMARISIFLYLWKFLFLCSAVTDYFVYEWLWLQISIYSIVHRQCLSRPAHPILQTFKND